MNAVIWPGPTARRPLLPRVGWALLLLGAILATANAVFFTFLPHYELPGVGNQDGALEKHRMFAITAVGFAHTLGGGAAMLIGPFQFLRGLRSRRPVLHRWLGRIYLVCVVLGGLAAIFLSPNSNARNTFGIAFICLGAAWIYTGARAYLSIRARSVPAHRRWMIRNYALTYAAVMLRLEMPLLILGLGVAPTLAMDIVGWGCWVPNLVIVELFMRWQQRKRPLAQFA